jgi:thiamine-monophosphate kinase
MYEHHIIEEYFLNKSLHRSDVIVGIGDDAAVVTVPAGKQLVLTMDTLNAGIHFPYPKKASVQQCYGKVTAENHEAITSPYDIGHKSAAVNLSDLAAMGAEPAWVTLSLSLPETSSHWLEEFSNGFMGVLNRFNTALIGGDLNRGALSITVEAHGFVNKGKAILRSTAQPGDLIYVSGKVGTAAYALALLQAQTNPKILEQVLPALNRPTPRVELGLALRGIATAMMDLSDGLSKDLTRILRASHYGAVVDLQACPIENILRDNLSLEQAYHYAFTGGDDYELCFTASPDDKEKIADISRQLNLPLTEIGRITHMPGITLLNADENCAKLKKSGYDHFEG